MLSSTSVLVQRSSDNMGLGNKKWLLNANWTTKFRISVRHCHWSHQTGAYTALNVHPNGLFVKRAILLERDNQNIEPQAWFSSSVLSSGSWSPYTLFYVSSNFFKSASVFLKFSCIELQILLMLLRYFCAKTRPRCTYVVFMWTIFIFIFIT